MVICGSSRLESVLKHVDPSTCISVEHTKGAVSVDVFSKFWHWLQFLETVTNFLICKLQNAS